MCIFCAAIPATAALGAAMHGKQAEARRRAETTSEQAPDTAPLPAARRPLPIAGITGLVLAGLVVGSVVTHVTTASG